MGAFSGLFGNNARVRVVEAFAENHDEALSARDIIDIAEVSRREAYLVLRKLAREGIIVPASVGRSKVRFYKLNPADIRGRMLHPLEELFTLGALESEMKRSDGIEQSMQLPGGFLTKYDPVNGLVKFKPLAKISIIRTYEETQSVFSAALKNYLSSSSGINEVGGTLENSASLFRTAENVDAQSILDRASQVYNIQLSAGEASAC